MDTVSRLAEPMRIGSVELSNRIFLAPMSGVTDLPMRERVWRHGAGLVVAEMVPGAALAQGKTESAQRIRRVSGCPHMIQLAGRQPRLMAEGARIAAGQGAEIIDINMGCPAKKVTGGYSGSALMRDPDLAVRLIEAVVEAVDVPVTVKMRLGWDDDNINAPELAQLAEAAGAQMVTVHGRTRCQFYKGQADWDAIKAVKDAISIPVVANGDVTGLAEAGKILRASGADAIMIGRAHYGQPWISGALVAEAANRPDPTPDDQDLSGYIHDHYEAMLSFYGPARGMRHARKHLGWYFDRHAADSDPVARATMMQSTDPKTVSALIAQIFDGARQWSTAA